MRRKCNLFISRLFLITALCSISILNGCSQFGLDGIFSSEPSYTEKDLEGLAFRTSEDYRFITVVFSEGGVVLSEGGRAPDVIAEYLDGGFVYEGVRYSVDIQLFYDYIEITDENGASAVFTLVQD